MLRIERRLRDTFWNFEMENKIERLSYIEIIIINIILIKSFVDNIFVQEVNIII